MPSPGGNPTVDRVIIASHPKQIACEAFQVFLVGLTLGAGQLDR
jgi:hypothetical protein